MYCTPVHRYYEECNIGQDSGHRGVTNQYGNRNSIMSSMYICTYTGTYATRPSQLSTPLSPSYIPISIPTYIYCIHYSYFSYLSPFSSYFPSIIPNVICMVVRSLYRWFISYLPTCILSLKQKYKATVPLTRIPGLPDVYFLHNTSTKSFKPDFHFVCLGHALVPVIDWAVKTLTW